MGRALLSGAPARPTVGIAAVTPVVLGLAGAEVEVTADQVTYVVDTVTVLGRSDIDADPSQHCFYERVEIVQQRRSIAGAELAQQTWARSAHVHTEREGVGVRF
jgi:hypothetical protein